MGKRSVPRMALAALPVLLLSQCAPQCAPAPVEPAPSIPSSPSIPLFPVNPSTPASTVPGPLPWSRVLRDVTPGGQFGFNLVDGVSRDGRSIDLDLVTTTGQLDVANGHLAELAFRWELTEDGSALIGLSSASPPSVVRRDLPTGNETPYPGPGSGWQIDATLGVTIDDAGRHVGVVAHHPALADPGAFVLDTSTGTWSRPDDALRVAGMVDSSGLQLFSADGSVDVFEFVRGPAGCDGCVELWKVGPTGSSLVNVGTAGGPPTTGQTWLLDVSPDGRFVLFGSTSADMEIPDGPPRGHLFVGDTVAATTAMVADYVDPTVGSISDDARVVAFVDLGGIPRILPRDTQSPGSWPVSPTVTARDAVHPASSIAISGNGVRLAYTDVNGAVLVADYLGTGR